MAQQTEMPILRAPDVILSCHAVMYRCLCKSPGRHRPCGYNRMGRIGKETVTERNCFAGVYIAFDRLHFHSGTFRRCRMFWRDGHCRFFRLLTS